MKRKVHKVTPPKLLEKSGQGFYMCNADVYSDGSKYWREVTCEKCKAKKRAK